MQNKMVKFDWDNWFKLEPDTAVVARYYVWEFASDYDYDFYNPRPYFENLVKGAFLTDDFTEKVYPGTQHRTFLESLAYWYDEEHFSYLRNDKAFVPHFADIVKSKDIDRIINRVEIGAKGGSPNDMVRFLYLMLYHPEFAEEKEENITESYVLQLGPALLYGAGGFDNDLLDTLKRISKYMKTPRAKEYFDWIMDNTFIDENKAKDLQRPRHANGELVNE